MSEEFKLGDQSPIAQGFSCRRELHNSIELAQLAALACASPEVMIGQVGVAATRRIGVGSGRIVLPHYSPLKVAETFGTLSGLVSDRIDLGI